MNKFWAAITVYDKRWFGQVRVGPGTRIMLALLCTLLILERRDRNAVAARAERPLTLQLGGQRDFESAKGPVYRRFAWLSIELHGAAANELDGVALILDEVRGEEERRVVSVLNRQPQWRSIGLNRARAELKLESQDGPLAVGSYRLIV